MTSVGEIKPSPSTEFEEQYMESEHPRLRELANSFSDSKNRSSSSTEKINYGGANKPPSRPPSDELKDMEQGNGHSYRPPTRSDLPHVLPHDDQSKWRLPLNTLRALGVIYGDIGTSPLYTVSSILEANSTDNPTNDQTIGAISLIIWTLIITVSIKYVFLILKADHHGEGGIFALSSVLMQVHDMPARLKSFAVLVALFGSSFVIGDGVITPAISVLSAIAGLEIEAPNVTNYVMPITLVILFFFFLFQYKGTSAIGSSFGPIMLLWFLAIAMLGIYNISKAPQIMAAFSPHYGILFLANAGGSNGFFLLGAVILCATGAEALYADLGHFGKLPIRISWFAVVLPCLLLNYIGQGAALLQDPTIFENAFFESMPTQLLWPMIILSTFATIIASQAMVTGAFSLVHQCLNFGYFPRVKVHHTSKHLAGQIYIPEINYILMVLCLAAVAGFQNSNALAGAYGVAVTAVMSLTSILFMLVMHYAWRVKWYWISLYGTIIFVIDLFFFTSNLTKIPQGGWFPLVIGLIFAFVMLIWKAGRAGIQQSLSSSMIPVESVERLVKKYALLRPRGISVFMNSSNTSAPMSFIKLLSRQKIVSDVCIFVTVHMIDQPFVLDMARYQVVELGEGLVGVTASYGYMEVPNAVDIVAEMLRTHSFRNSFSEEYPTLKIEDSIERLSKVETSPPEPLKSDKAPTSPLYKATITFYLSQEKLETNKKRWIGHRVWVALFRIMHRNARSAVSMFRIPSEDTIEVGCKVVL